MARLHSVSHKRIWVNVKDKCMINALKILVTVIIVLSSEEYVFYIKN